MGEEEESEQQEDLPLQGTWAEPPQDVIEPKSVLELLEDRSLRLGCSKALKPFGGRK